MVHADRRARWLTPAYAAALLLIFAGERVLAPLDWARCALSGAGVLLQVGTTLLWIATARSARGERRRAERMLAGLSSLGVLAITMYFTTAGFSPVATSGARARVQALGTVAWTTLLFIAVVPLLLGTAALAPMRRAAHIEARRVHEAVLSGLSLGFAAVYAALFVYGAGGLDLTLGAAQHRKAKLGDATRSVVERLAVPVELIAFFPRESDVGDDVAAYADEVRSLSPSIRFQRVDQLLSPAMARDAGVTQNGVLIVQREGLREEIALGVDARRAEVRLGRLDRTFRGALLSVVRGERTAYFTTGHGELTEETGTSIIEGRTATRLRALVASTRYEVKDLKLSEAPGGDVPGDAALLIVLGPTRGFSAAELDALKRFADRGGRLLLALDPEGKVDLDPLARVVGLTWRPEIIVDDSHFIRWRHTRLDRTALVTTSYTAHASVTKVSTSQESMPTVFPGASSLDKAAGSDVQFHIAVQTMPEAFVDKDGDLAFDPQDELRKRYTIAMAAWKTKPLSPGSDQDEREMRAFVIADADALSDRALGNGPNLVLAADALRWLGIEQKEQAEEPRGEERGLVHMRSGDQGLFWAVLLAPPSLVLALGLWLSRRTRS